MKTYITEKEIGSEKHEGPEIKANSWKLAEEEAQEIDVSLVGELKMVWFGG